MPHTFHGKIPSYIFIYYYLQRCFDADCHIAVITGRYRSETKKDLEQVESNLYQILEQVLQLLSVFFILSLSNVPSDAESAKGKPKTKETSAATGRNMT